MKIETIVITGGIGSGKSSVIESIKRQTEKRLASSTLMISLKNFMSVKMLKNS